MKRSTSVLAAAVMLGFGSMAFAGTLVVNDFGAGGWTSWDTRNTSNIQLVGTNDTNALGVAYFGKAASTADDAAIAKQIMFVGEGQIVNDAAGITPPASPTGSLNGKGYVRLDGTNSNSGKTDISYVNTGGIAAASTLADPSFSASYTFFAQSDPTSREPGLNISVIGTDAIQYTFANGPAYNPNSWNTISISDTSGIFTVHSSNGANGISGTLAQLAANPTYGALMFGSGAEVWRVGFNVGSGQKQGLVYLDDMQTTILNGGDVIDFQGPSAAPLPASALSGLVLLGGLSLAAGMKRLRRQEA